MHNIALRNSILIEGEFLIIYLIVLRVWRNLFIPIQSVTVIYHVPGNIVTPYDQWNCSFLTICFMAELLDKFVLWLKRDWPSGEY